MNVLVTGAAGFIGSHIVEELLNRGYFVVALDNLSFGNLENLKEFNRQYNDKLVIVRGDIRDLDLITKLIKEYEIEMISHHAAISSATMFIPDPREGFNINIQGFLNILEAARRFDVIKVIHASTSSIYNGLPPPHREDMYVQPRTFYEHSHWISERIAKIYYELYGIEIINFRYFSVYGPREQHKGNFANIISQFLWKMMKGEAPVIFGNGSQTRDFTFVKDVARANILALEKNGLGGELFNIGTGKETSFNEVVALLNKHLGTQIKPKYVPNPIKNYVYRTLADTSKARKILGFEAKIDLETGIKIIIDYYRRILRNS